MDKHTSTIYKPTKTSLYKVFKEKKSFFFFLCETKTQHTQENKNFYFFNMGKTTHMPWKEEVFLFNMRGVVQLVRS
jgi:hypothetical protein